MLNTIHYGTPSDDPSVLIVHGLFGSARNWGVIAKRLGQTRHVVAVDMRNHANSPWETSHSYPDMAADLSQVIATLPGGVADVIGHSMGGKAAMVLALTDPARVGRLLVADIAPVTYDHTQGHNIDAMRAVDLDSVTTRAQAAEQLIIDPPGVAAFLLQSLDLQEKRWRLNLDVLAADMDKIIGFPEITGQFTGDTLFLSGALSDYVRPEHRAVIKPLFPDAKFAKIPDAGHWLHAEQPRAFEATARAFLRIPQP